MRSVTPAPPSSRTAATVSTISSISKDRTALAGHDSDGAVLSFDDGKIGGCSNEPRNLGAHFWTPWGIAGVQKLVLLGLFHHYAGVFASASPVNAKIRVTAAISSLMVAHKSAAICFACLILRPGAAPPPRIRAGWRYVCRSIHAGEARPAG